MQNWYTLQLLYYKHQICVIGFWNNYCSIYSIMAYMESNKKSIIAIDKLINEMIINEGTDTKEIYNNLIAIK